MSKNKINSFIVLELNDGHGTAERYEIRQIAELDEEGEVLSSKFICRLPHNNFSLEIANQFAAAPDMLDHLKTLGAHLQSEGFYGLWMRTERVVAKAKGLS